MNIGNLQVLSSKDAKAIRQALTEQWGITIDLPLLQKDTDIFVITRDVDGVDISQLRVNSAGLYIGEFRHGEMRLSIEGTQLFGKQATKNVVEINEEEKDAWIRGENLEREGEAAFVIVKYKNDFLGCGRRKEGVLMNFVPKSRRINRTL